MLTGFMGGMMASFIDPIRIGLQESVRKVTVRVLWDEHGRRDQSFEVIQYLTDPAKLDLALTGGRGCDDGHRRLDRLAAAATTAGPVAGQPGQDASESGR